MFEHLPQARLIELARALFRVPLPYDPVTRAALFTSVPVSCVMRLPVVAVPSLQLQGDLGAMNGLERLADGKVPFLIWLENVAAAASGTMEEQIFRKAADDIAHRVSGAPRLDPPTLPEFKEAIIHQDDMVSQRFMARGLAAGSAVAKLRVPRFDQGQMRRTPEPVYYLGTGWLLAGALLITNHHVINARNEGEVAAAQTDLGLQATAMEVRFDFDDEGLEGAVVAVSALEAFDVKLDYAIVRLAANTREPLRPAAQPLQREAGSYIPVNIVQHPAGQSKKYAIRNNLVSAVAATELRYFTDTRPGSSGAPVFNDAWDVVGLHRGSTYADGVSFQGRSTAWVNLGTPVHAILGDVAARYPTLRAEIPT